MRKETGCCGNDGSLRPEKAGDAVKDYFVGWCLLDLALG